MGKKNKNIVSTNDLEKGVFLTGFPILDMQIGRDHIKDLDNPDDYYRIRGVRSSSLLSIFSQPTMGKTTFFLNLAGNIARKYPFNNLNDTHQQIHFYSSEGGASLARVCATTGIPYGGKNTLKRIKVHDRSGVNSTQHFRDLIFSLCDDKDKNPEKYKGEVRLGNNKIAERYLPTVVVLDSYSKLTPEELKKNKEFKNTDHARRANINGQIMGKIKDAMGDYNIIVFIIQHESELQGQNVKYKTKKKRGYNRNIRPMGGKPIEYEIDVQLRLNKIVASNEEKTHEKYIKKKYLETPFTSIVRAVITKNRYGDANDHMFFHLVQNRLYGFDPLHSYIYDLIDKSVLDKNGSWYTVKGRDKSFRAGELVNLIKEDHEFCKLLKRQINEKYHPFLKHHDTDKILNEKQNVIDRLL